MTNLENIYRGRRVLVTGDTGFKGSWLCWWLKNLGADVFGFGLPPIDNRQIYVQARLNELVPHRDIDLRNSKQVLDYIAGCRAEVVFHLAAQALVRLSYEQPIETFETNVMGTLHLLEGIRKAGQPCAVVVVTSDKCYENHEWSFGYRENDQLGGYDPYSASKGCTEIAVAAFRRSFFPASQFATHGVAVASARAGNVIGPGDWAMDRMLPDAINSLFNNQPIPVRNPGAIRPWQHVLEPFSGYLTLGARLLGSLPHEVTEAWNFGPYSDSCRPVQALIEEVIKTWGRGEWEDRSDPNAAHEANFLRLAIDKAVSRLHWQPVWDFETAISRTVKGYKTLAENQRNNHIARELLDNEIKAYTNSAKELEVSWAI